MQDTRQRITTLLKGNGGLTTGELSQLLGISPTAVRRHLSNLVVQEAVSYRIEQRGMGRPSYIYELRNGVSSAFPQSYTSFARSLLHELDQLEGENRPHELFDRHQEQRQAQYLTHIQGETLSDRVASLAQLMESEGRMTTWQQLHESCFILREHNCPLLQLARDFDYPCRCELALLRTTLKAEVRRVGHIAHGDVACVYVIDGRGNGKHAERWVAPQWVERRHQVPLTLLAGEAPRVASRAAA